MATEMRVWEFSDRGDPSKVIKFTTRKTPAFPPPQPLPRDAPQLEEWVLIETAFAALNVGFIFQMTLIPQMIRTKTCVPEMDMSGVVQEVWHPEREAAPLQTLPPFRFQRGDNVVAMLPASHSLATGTGALAEYVAIPAKYVVHKPDNVSFGDAAGCPLAGMTARQQVIESCASIGDAVLVNAASDGIGTMVVQMVRNVVGESGFVVGICSGICSGKNAELVKSIGADEVIDYKKHVDLPLYLKDAFSDKPFNVIIDTLGHQSLYLIT